MATLRTGLRAVRFVIPIVVYLLIGVPIFAAPPSFSTKRQINTVINGLLPFDVRTVDLDQDGDMDI